VAIAWALCSVLMVALDGRIDLTNLALILVRVRASADAALCSSPVASMAACAIGVRASRIVLAAARSSAPFQPACAAAAD
jgi:hypothetical protein